MRKEQNKCPSKRDAVHTCKKYGIAITDYVLGEEMDISREDLFNHLATCEKCRKDLDNWRENYAALRNEAYLRRPDVREKYQQMLQSIKKGETVMSQSPEVVKKEMVRVVGTGAGEIYKCLKADGPAMFIPQIKAKVTLTDAVFHQSLGWLEREDKVIVDHKTEIASLYRGG
ncbi:MAG: winged helix-turn-helix domain-containing protein [Planctomycetota bacterium]|nr:winged helix-turn-helix domain-containing protein [Planctomycetota bacterium]MDI6788409.1 winged helix-turn-helix domain-containing protein [Planctomycetota bacterium]